MDSELSQFDSHEDVLSIVTLKTATRPSRAIMRAPLCGIVAREYSRRRVTPCCVPLHCSNTGLSTIYWLSTKPLRFAFLVRSGNLSGGGLVNDGSLKTLGVLDVYSLHVGVKLLLGTLLVVTLTADADTEAERNALDAGLPDLLVQLRVEADVGCAL